MIYYWCIIGCGLLLTLLVTNSKTVYWLYHFHPRFSTRSMHCCHVAGRMRFHINERLGMLGRPQSMKTFVIYYKTIFDKMSSSIISDRWIPSYPEPSSELFWIELECLLHIQRVCCNCTFSSVSLQEIIFYSFFDTNLNLTNTFIATQI